jgi:hypothetical protein
MSRCALPDALACQTQKRAAENTVKVFDNCERMIYRNRAPEVTNLEKGVSSLKQ